MKLLVDSADISEIESLLASFPIDGVTTNPVLIAKEKRPFKQQFQEIRHLLPDRLPLHVQIIADDCKGMIDQARTLYDWLDGNVWIKIPVSKEGLRAIRELSADSIRTTGTTIYTPLQAVLAAKAGAGYVAHMSTGLIMNTVMGRVLSKRLPIFSDHTVLTAKCLRQALNITAKFSPRWKRGAMKRRSALSF